VTKKDPFLNYYDIIDRQSILDVEDLIVPSKNKNKMKHQQKPLEVGELAYTVIRAPRLTIRQRSIVECEILKVHSETIRNPKNRNKTTTFIDYTVKTPLGIFREDLVYKTLSFLKTKTKLKRKPISFDYD
jgi:hypothetical protein